LADLGTMAPDPAPGPRRTRPPKRRRGPLGRHPFRLLTALFVVVLVLAGLTAVSWYDGAKAPQAGGAGVVVTVPAGASLRSMLPTLVKDRILGSTLAFKVYLDWHGNPTLRTGAHYLHQNAGFDQTRLILQQAPDVFEVNVHVGTTVSEVAAQVGDIPGHSAAAFQSAATSGAVTSQWQPKGSTNLDGLLGPGSYQVIPGEADQQLLVDMVTAFDTEAASVGLTAGAAKLQMTPAQVIIVASIVQKEAMSPGDSTAAGAFNAPRVARVVYNRLAQGIRLQMDSTVLYALGQDGGTVTPADLKVASPYNTYLHTGLPPTPTCFPSVAALQAALNPELGTWIYFVLTASDGTETFSVTSAEQIAAEKLAQSRGLP
jgi:UPF0755 protein